MLFAWYMALAEPRNSGTKTLCICLSPGKLEIMIFIVTCAPPFIHRVLENPGQNISYTYLHDNCIFKKKKRTKIGVLPISISLYDRPF